MRERVSATEAHQVDAFPEVFAEREMFTPAPVHASEHLDSVRRVSLQQLLSSLAKRRVLVIDHCRVAVQRASNLAVLSFRNALSARDLSPDDGMIDRRVRR